MSFSFLLEALFLTAADQLYDLVPLHSPSLNFPIGAGKSLDFAILRVPVVLAFCRSLSLRALALTPSSLPSHLN